MKTLFAFAVIFFCVYIAVAEDSKSCESGADCDEDECCLQINIFSKALCRKLREKDNWCVPDLSPDAKLYRFMCPCGKGLSCIPEEKEEKNGVTIYKNTKCLEDSTEDEKSSKEEEKSSKEEEKSSKEEEQQP
ncbi:prokineticin domain-containing protein [Caerostris extrusa]|uniref:Prokineticin domain-containing protein n=1 Tax=Caerostris extrusa TaxID=172846 RepID=A0AAV4U0Q3_CAEEX|nr:prokineticin domain-containing protein [Caerostris extrusa]